MEKSENKVEVAEEICCGNELKSLQKIGSKNEMSFNKKLKSWKKLVDNFRLDHFIVEVNYENDN